MVEHRRANHRLGRDGLGVPPPYGRAVSRGRRLSASENTRTSSALKRLADFVF